MSRFQYKNSDTKLSSSHYILLTKSEYIAKLSSLSFNKLIDSPNSSNVLVIYPEKGKGYK